MTALTTTKPQDSRSPAKRAATSLPAIREQSAAAIPAQGSETAAAAKLRAPAARRQYSNAAAALDVDTRRDVRIRVDAEVILLPADGKCRSTTLENISRRGLSLTGVPSNWEPRRSVSFALISAGRHLDVTGRVSWRRDETVGISFNEPTSGRRLLRELT